MSSLNEAVRPPSTKGLDFIPVLPNILSPATDILGIPSAIAQYPGY